MTADPTPTRATWDQAWEHHYENPTFHVELMNAVSAVMELRGARTLEVGCGVAPDSAEMQRRGAAATATDVSHKALKRAQDYAVTQGVEFPVIAVDLFHLPFPDNTFDLVFSQGLLEHFTDPAAALRDQVRVVRPGGYVCVDVPQTWSLVTLWKRWHMARGTWFAGWETNFELNELESLLERGGLEVVSSYGSMYFPAFPLLALRNIHTLDDRHHVPVWLPREVKKAVESGWAWLERKRWYYRWMGCIGVIARK